jgi:hypothetical protein
MFQEPTHHCKNAALGMSVPSGKPYRQVLVLDVVREACNMSLLRRRPSITISQRYLGACAHLSQVDERKGLRGTISVILTTV